MRIARPLNKNGQSLVEMALLLPVLLILSVVLIDVGRGIYYYSAVYNAAREGARFGIIEPENFAGIDTAARRLTVGLDQTKVNVSMCECGKNCAAIVSCPAGATNLINVGVSYNFQIITPMANMILGRSSFLLKSTSIMAIER